MNKKSNKDKITNTNVKWNEILIIHKTIRNKEYLKMYVARAIWVWKRKTQLFQLNEIFSHFFFLSLVIFFFFLFFCLFFLFITFNILFSHGINFMFSGFCLFSSHVQKCSIVVLFFISFFIDNIQPGTQVTSFMLLLHKVDNFPSRNDLYCIDYHWPHWILCRPI